MKHTKGPWAVDGHNLTSVIAIDERSSDTHTFYKHVCTCDYGYAKPEEFIDLNKANAKLIACAPEMLEMLQSLLPNLKKANKATGTWDEYIADINSLIAKATA